MCWELPPPNTKNAAGIILSALAAVYDFGSILFSDILIKIFDVPL